MSITVKEYSKMTILKRISDIQMELLVKEVTQKNGFHGKYMSLEALNSIILPLCHERNLMYYFTCSETHLILEIYDFETGERLSPPPHVRLPELTKDMKAEGGNNTYMKRYVLMNTFLIFAESFDPDDTQNGLPPEKNNASSAKKETVKKQESAETVKSDFNIQELYEDALKKLREVKGLSDNEITDSAIRKQIFNDGNFTNKSERNDIARYCKKNWRPSK